MGKTKSNQAAVSFVLGIACFLGVGSCIMFWRLDFFCWGVES
jgi:hypothetical protein